MRSCRSCVPVLWLGAKGIKNKQGERGRCRCGFLGGSGGSSKGGLAACPHGGTRAPILCTRIPEGCSASQERETLSISALPWGVYPRAENPNLVKTMKKNWNETIFPCYKSWGRLLGLFPSQLMPGQFFFCRILVPPFVSRQAQWEHASD